MEKKRRNQIIIVISGIIVAVLVILFGFLFGTDFYQKIILFSEVERISKLDIIKDQFDSEIKTSGDYGKVEEAVKEYFSEYSQNLQATLNAISEEKLNEIMSEENLIEDAPDFEKILENIQNTKEEFNTNVDALIQQMDEEAIMAKIQSKDVGEKFKNLYKEIMFDDEIMEQVERKKS